MSGNAPPTFEEVYEEGTGLLAELVESYHALTIMPGMTHAGAVESMTAYLASRLDPVSLGLVLTVAIGRLADREAPPP